MSTEICVKCNPGEAGVYPFEREKTISCLCVPADYEQCAECGFDHEYDPAEAVRAHQLIAWAAEEQEASGRTPAKPG